MSKLLQTDIRKLYLKYLATCFGSTLIVCIYSLVDMIVVGQYEGPDGTAAITTVLPLWSAIFSIGLLFGIGGSVLMSAARGAGQKERGDQFFTIAGISIGSITVIAWVVTFFFDRQLLELFGARDRFLELGLEYVFWIKLVLPLFILGQFLACFIRNDNAPGLATAAVMAGGGFNIFGDIFFVFTCDMGTSGAGLATAIGQSIATAILLTHFLSKKCQLRFVKPTQFFSRLKSIVSTGLSTFLVEIAVGILTTLFNNQIMAYTGSSSLAVYGVASNVSALVQACGSGVGQASQPILSENFGAGQLKRVSQTLRLGILTTLILGILFVTLTLLFPTELVHLFMDATPDVLEIAPSILRVYFISFFMLPFNIFASYYFQAILRAKTALAVSIFRGIAMSGVLIYVLPLFAVELLWWVMPITECLTVFMIVFFLWYSNRKIRQEAPQKTT